MTRLHLPTLIKPKFPEIPLKIFAPNKQAFILFHPEGSTHRYMCSLRYILSHFNPVIGRNELGNGYIGIFEAQNDRKTDRKKCQRVLGTTRSKHSLVSAAQAERVEPNPVEEALYTVVC